MTARFKSLLVRGSLNTALALAVLVTVWRLAAPAPTSSARDGPTERRLRIGSSFALPDPEMSVQRTVVLAVQVTCPGCIKSVPFYQNLVSVLEESPTTDLVVVSPDPRDAVQAWLRHHAIRARIHAPVDLSKLGFAITPTLLFVDRNGVVTDIAAGFLVDNLQQHVHDRLRGLSANPVNQVKHAQLIFDQELAELSRRNPETLLLDIRPRQEFAAGHRQGATNLPHDELVERIPAEASLTVPMVIDCIEQKFGPCEIAGEQLLRLGIREVFLLVSGRAP